MTDDRLALLRRGLEMIEMQVRIYSDLDERAMEVVHQLLLAEIDGEAASAEDKRPL